MNSECLFSFFVVHQVFDAVEVEAQREAHSLVQRVGRCQTYAVTYIQRYDAQVETGTEGDVVTVTFVEILVAVTGTS